MRRLITVRSKKKAPQAGSHTNKRPGNSTALHIFFRLKSITQCARRLVERLGYPRRSLSRAVETKEVAARLKAIKLKN
jgi:hypothetical protein